MTLAARIRAIASGRFVRPIAPLLEAYEAAFGRGAVWRDVLGAMALAALMLWGLAAIGVVGLVMRGAHG